MARWDGYVKKQKSCSNLDCNNLVWKGKYCSKCRRRLRVHGDVNKILPKHRTFFFNENFVLNETKESSWFVGWIASDGNITKNLNTIQISICDREILERFEQLIGFSGGIKLRKPRTTGLAKFNNKPIYRLTINSKIMCDSFVKIGITPNKSKTIQMPLITDGNFYHFFRGLIEGDGSIITSGKRLFVFLNSASLIFLEQLKERINLTSKIREMKPGVFRLVYNDDKAGDLCKRIYQDSEGIRLERKYQKYQEHLSYLNNVQ